jgi:hypothetical protein
VEAPMRLLTENEMKQLSFPDCIVEEMKFDIPQKIVKIKTDIGYLSSDGGVKLKNCELIIRDWSELKVSLYRAATKQWEKLDVNQIEKLVDICEFEYDKKIIFRGFGKKTGQWIEVVFLDGTLKVNCN